MKSGLTSSLWSLQVCVSLPRQRLRSPRHPGHPAVQTQRVRQPDQPEHGERLGNPALCHRHLPQAGRGQVLDPEGPEQGEAAQSAEDLKGSWEVSELTDILCSPSAASDPCVQPARWHLQF